MSDKNKVLCSAFLLGVCSFTLVAVENAAPAVKADSALTPGARHSVSRHTVGYLEKENEAANIVKKANELFQKEDYFQARDTYIKAKKALSAINASYYRDRIRFCDEQINMCYYEIANQALKKAEASAVVNDYDEAIRLCREAADYYPECKVVMEKKIARYSAVRKTVAIQQNTSASALIPDKELQEYEISMLLRRARALVNAGLYDKAKRIYQDILFKNPYRSDVLQDLRAVNVYIEEAGRRRRLNSRRASVAANELEWALPIQREVEKTVEAFEKPVEKTVTVENPLVNKLKAIRIPRISFDEIKLRKVLDTLVTLSEQNDPSRVGINIFLRQNVTGEAEKNNEAENTTAAAATEENTENQNEEQKKENTDDDEEEGEEETLVEDDESHWTELEKTTLTLPDMVDKSLEEIIRNICTNAKLRYRVEKNVVVIEELNMPETELESKIFPADATALSDAGDPANAEDLMSYFKDKGVAFPQGSKIVFDPRISRIFATNTPENLDKIEEVCAESLNSAEGDTLVQIQLRVIEISQTDLNALGFNYTLSDRSGKNAADRVFDSIETKNQLGDVKSSTTTNASIGMGDFSLDVNINALDDLTSRDVLASPRVTTLPNETVSIKLVTENYFAEDWEESETETNQAENGQLSYTYVGPFPNFESEPQELGISFTTKPTIGENGEITMDLEPSISSLVGWTYYEGTDDDGNTETLRTPNIAKRTLRTNVTIKDGETLVLGGVIEDNVTQKKNKVPLLGDIPLIGRLFQSREYDSTKKNLLIFVTPRLIKPDGTFKNPENHEGNRGIARFL